MRVYFIIPFFDTDPAIFFLFVDHVNKPTILVFGAFVYHFNKNISIFLTILYIYDFDQLLQLYQGRKCPLLPF